ncbi:MAG: hypothetical protein ACRDWD_04770 [Acidimicrobiia bacterium]
MFGRVFVVFSALLVGGGALAACGDDGGGGSADDAFCQARFSVETATGGGDEADLDQALSDLETEAPSDIEDDVAFVSDTFREEGNKAFRSEEFVEALASVDEYVIDNCDVERMDVTGLEYSFEGIPDELEAGQVGIVFDNEGEEAHELLIVRFNDDTTETLEDIVQLREREARELVTDAAGTFAEPGDTSRTFADLEPGRYGAVCFVPTPDGVPHAHEGMIAEFEVT